jgi:hypothetical protein
MDIVFKDNTKKTVPFNAEFAARAIKKSMGGEKIGYKVRLNPEHDREKHLKQKNDIEHYLSEFDRIAGLAGKL